MLKHTVIGISADV